jgi:hypothetical protein
MWPGSYCRYQENSLMQVSPIFDSVWKTMRRCLNGSVGFAFAAALLVVITYQLVYKPATAQGITYALSGRAAKSGTTTPTATLSAQFSQQEAKFVGTGNPIQAIAPTIIAQGQQPERGVRVRPAGQTKERRIALVIGNGAYTATQTLRNPPNDAREMTAALRSLGFDVSSAVDVGQRQMKQLIREFGQKLKGGGVGLFYYAGHGVQSKDRNYLIPFDADIQSETDVEDLAVDVNLVLGLMDEAKNGLNIVILDACRNNPFSRSYRTTTNGLAQMSAPTGTLIAYATAPGSVASDGAGPNGLYTSELLKQMKEPWVSIEIVFKRVGMFVSTATGGHQEPWIASSLRGDFYFAAGSNTNVGQASSVSTSPPITSNRPPSATELGGGTSYQIANAIASKDIGSLRVVLKSAMQVNHTDQRGRSVNGIRCAFEFINLETQRPIVVAMNAIAPDRGRDSMGSYLRSTLVDENGGLWRLPTPDVAGMSIVGVGQQGYFVNNPFYNPAEIVSLLSKRDDLNSDVVTSQGRYESRGPNRSKRDDLNSGVVTSQNGHYESRDQNRFIFGSTTEMSPGQRLMVTMTFVQNEYRTTSPPPPKVFQLATEIVVGIVTSGTKKSYSLHNVTFDRVSPPGR